MKISDFYKDEFSDYALYDVYRSIGSYVDGLKSSSRKVVHVVGKNNIKSRTKVAQLVAKVAEQTEYLHGENSLGGVIVHLAQDFAGSNNLNVLVPNGNFGNRAVPENAATRYIFTQKADCFDGLFDSRDAALLTEQIFEGTKIEPRFFMPTLPLILINGSEGIGSGWSQKVLPRTAQVMKKAIKRYLEDGALPTRIKPSFRNFEGTVAWNPEKENWIVCGKFERVNSSTLRITELPVGYTLDKYLEILNQLEERKIIRNYRDLTDPGLNKFEFIVNCRREWLEQDDDIIYKKLKLQRQISENFTCLDENNVVREFKSETEILEAFIAIRLEYYARRKAYILADLQRQIDVAEAKYRFVKMVVDGDIALLGKKKAQVETQLVANEFPKVEDSFDFLLRMPVHSLTEETMKTLQAKAAEMKKEMKLLQAKTEKALWQEDLENV